MGTPFLNDRQSTKDVKQYIKPHSSPQPMEKQPKEPKSGSLRPPAHLPVRGSGW